jgi:exopolysaccharide biosynthesis polyprenyl glycosylphosphotransferase
MSVTAVGSDTSVSDLVNTLAKDLVIDAEGMPGLDLVQPVSTIGDGAAKQVERPMLNTGESPQALTYDVPERPAPNPRTWERRYAGAALVVDGITAMVAALVAHSMWPAGATPTVSWIVAIAVPFLWVAVIALAGGYQRRFLGIGTQEFNRVAIGCLTTIAVVGTLSWATNTQIARGYVIVALPLAGVLTLAGRYLLRKRVHRQRERGRFVHRTLLVGPAQGIDDLHRHLERRRYHGYDVVGACLIGPEPDAPTEVPVLGTFDEIAYVVRCTGADTVAVVPNSQLSGAEVRRLSWQLAPSGASVVVAPAVVDVVGPRMAVRPVEGLPLLHLEQPVFTGLKRAVKQVYDPIVAGVALVVLFPVFVAVALAIRIDSHGPVFFRQVRVGEMGRQFRIWKFRTMVADAEQRKAELTHLNEGAGPLFKLRRDPRITVVGRVLRKTSLDELPQLFNVVAGQMSIVGPRPHLPSEVAQFGSDFQRRLLVKPGLTGLWQVSGRSDLSFEESVNVDLRYVENWSLGLDIFIVWKTLRVMVLGEGAY